MKQVAAVVNSDKLSNMNNITFMKAISLQVDTIITELEAQNERMDNFDERLSKFENVKQANIIDVTPTTKKSAYVRNNVYSPASIAMAFGIGSRTLNNILASEGVIKRVMVYYAKTSRNEKHWIITDKFRNMKYSAQKYAGLTSPGYLPVEVTYTWTPKGVAFIVNLLKYKGYTQQSEINNRTKTRT